MREQSSERNLRGHQSTYVAVEPPKARRRVHWDHASLALPRNPSLPAAESTILIGRETDADRQAVHSDWVAAFL